MSKQNFFSNRLGKEVELEPYSYTDRKGNPVTGVKVASIRELMANTKELQKLVVMPRIDFANDNYVIATAEVREQGAPANIAPLAVGIGTTKISDKPDAKFNAPEIAFSEAYSAAIMSYLQLPVDMYTDLQVPISSTTAGKAASNVASNASANKETKNTVPTQQSAATNAQPEVQNTQPSVDDTVSAGIENVDESVAEETIVDDPTSGGIITTEAFDNGGEYDYVDADGTTGTVDENTVLNGVANIPALAPYDGHTVKEIKAHLESGKAVASQIAFIGTICTACADAESPFNTSQEKNKRIYKYLANHVDMTKVKSGVNGVAA